MPKRAPRDANVQMYDPASGVVVINETDIETASVREAMIGQHPELAALIRWTITTRGDMGSARQGSIFARDRYVTPTQIFDVFRTARDAVASDDVVSGVMEGTEALAFGRMSFSADDEDEEDVWNQIALDLDLDSRIREMWRELFTYSQMYAVTWWGQDSYRVRGKNSDTGVRRKRTFDNLTVPMGISLLDPTKVVPVGNLMFNNEQLAYIADRTEIDTLDAAVLNDPEADPVSRAIIVAKYAPPDYERRNLAKLGINAEWLYILNPRYVWRHTLTRPQYERFSEVRLRSIFELLDLKQQLRQMDRAHLIGGTNFIVLVKKGSEQHPAKPEELANLGAQVRTVAQTPIMVGDHRLNVEIITPKNDTTLNNEKYSVIDSRITTRLYQMFLVHGGTGMPRSDDSVKLAKVIARGLETRRFMLRRTLERRVVAPAVDANPQLNSFPTLRFHPTRIELDFDSAIVQFLMDLRDRGDLSRESILAELDFNEADEAVKRQREARDFDHIFAPTNIPWGTPSALQAPGAYATPTGELPAGAPGSNSGAGSTSTSGNAQPSKAPGGTKKAAPAKKAAPVKKAATPVNPRSSGRNLGGNRRGGGSAPGTGQGQSPRRGRPKDT